MRRLSRTQNPARYVDEQELRLRGRLSPGLNPAMRGPYLPDDADLSLRGPLPAPTGYERALDEARVALANDPGGNFSRGVRALVHGLDFKATDEVAGLGTGVLVGAGNALANYGFETRSPYSAIDAARAARVATEEEIRRYRADYFRARSLEAAGSLLSPINDLTAGLAQATGGGLRGAMLDGLVSGAVEGAADARGDDRLSGAAQGAMTGAFAGDVTHVPKYGIGTLAERLAPAMARSRLGKVAGELGGRALDKVVGDGFEVGVEELARRLSKSLERLDSLSAADARLRGSQSLTIPGNLRGPLR